jgi:hypothetical protein
VVESRERDKDKEDNNSMYLP